MTAEIRFALRELHSRSTDGIQVRLLWREHDDRVVVSVTDTKAGHGFTVEVGEHDRPLDVFHHPYAHAAWRGVDTGQDSGSAEPIGLLAA